MLGAASPAQDLRDASGSRKRKAVVWFGFLGCCNVPHCSPSTAAVLVPRDGLHNLMGFVLLIMFMHHPHVPLMTPQHMVLLEGPSDGSKKTISLLVSRKKKKNLHTRSLPIIRSSLSVFSVGSVPCKAIRFPGKCCSFMYLSTTRSQKGAPWCCNANA